MGFERAVLQAKLRAKLKASALIRGGLALGLKRRAKGGCGGISRLSPFLPSLRLPLTDGRGGVIVFGQVGKAWHGWD
jgi:hypothetical protein